MLDSKCNMEPTPAPHIDLTSPNSYCTKNVKEKKNEKKKSSEQSGAVVNIRVHMMSSRLTRRGPELVFLSFFFSLDSNFIKPVNINILSFPPCCKVIILFSSAPSWKKEVPLLGFFFFL